MQVTLIETAHHIPGQAGDSKFNSCVVRLQYHRCVFVHNRTVWSGNMRAEEEEIIT